MPRNRKTVLIVNDLAMARALQRRIMEVIKGMDAECAIVLVDTLEDTLMTARKCTESEFFVLADVFDLHVKVDAFIAQLREQLGARLRETVIVSSLDETDRSVAEQAGALFAENPFNEADWETVANAIERFLLS
jgi:hypothetical protein